MITIQFIDRIIGLAQFISMPSYITRSLNNIRENFQNPRWDNELLHSHLIYSVPDLLMQVRSISKKRFGVGQQKGLERILLHDIETLNSIVTSPFPIFKRKVVRRVLQ